MPNAPIEQVRDRIAELTGHTKHFAPGREYSYWVHESSTAEVCHSVFTTLDGIAAMMPKEYEQSINSANLLGCWLATAIDKGGRSDYHAEAPTELEARTRLLLAVLEQENPHAH